MFGKCDIVYLDKNIRQLNYNLHKYEHKQDYIFGLTFVPVGGGGYRKEN